MTLPAGAPDPFKGLRGVFAGTLAMEAIVVALALLVVLRFGYTGAVGAAYTGALALALQVAMVIGAFAHYALGVAGLLFCLVWAYLLWLRHVVARRMSEGTLPAQQQE